MKKEYIINEIIRTTKKNSNIPLGMDRFKKETGIKKNDWLGKYWTKWGDAVIEAGYQPNKFQEAFDEELLIKKLIVFIKEIKKFPTLAELGMKSFNDKSFPCDATFWKRFGNKNAMAKKIIEYCEKKKEFPEVLKICHQIANTPKKNENIEENKDENIFGYVYLIKSGKYYKIGRSNSTGRRDYEINLQLPEKTNKIHEIPTDDPSGIEKYWHDRFKDKRKNGEWFKLDKEDISAFKRRKFM